MVLNEAFCGQRIKLVESNGYKCVTAAACTSVAHPQARQRHRGVTVSASGCCLKPQPLMRVWQQTIQSDANPSSSTCEWCLFLELLIGFVAAKRVTSCWLVPSLKLACTFPRTSQYINTQPGNDHNATMWQHNMSCHQSKKTNKWKKSSKAIRAAQPYT